MTWEIDSNKYFTQEEVAMLFSKVRELDYKDKLNCREKWQKIWMLVDFVFNTGCRVSEIKNLMHKHIFLTGTEPRIHVVDSKYNKSRFVPLSDSVISHVKEYIAFKSMIIQSTAPDSYFMQSRKGNSYSTAGLQHLFKQAVHLIGIDKSIHSARHTFATTFYGKTRCIRSTQKLLGHSSIATTQVYVDVPFSSLVENCNGLYNI